MKIIVEKTKGKFLYSQDGKWKWCHTMAPIHQTGATFHKMEGKYRMTITLPSGKKVIVWKNSFTSVSQVAAEYGVSSDQIRWKVLASFRSQ